MGIARKIKEKILGYTEEEGKEIARILKSPKINAIRHGTGPRIQADTFEVVRKYVVGKRKNK